ncbi:acylphosphatase [Desulfurococcus mucosus]|uniref:Acylphosphatase n=1 Tax=Desulfurococcus mucosus (strain ATCC 35584 / DSM 2162 / JCM 9187 / O7/1) TaxID=765177 RepID=E8R8D9_DESM0|nr:acylphosphatase [Desulfurococcus mucosus DSM 2162]
MPPGELVRARIRVRGLVQGVFFRATMKEVADQLGVSGWVRNLPDGSVEAVVEGERQRVEELIKWAHRGPPAARVEAVEVEWEPYKGEFKGFKIKYY